MPTSYEPATIFILAPGAFFVLAFFVAIRNKMMRNEANGRRKTAKTVML
ncbi:MAG: hypothetical protein ACLU80_04285 [Dorea sp.]